MDDGMAHSRRNNHDGDHKNPLFPVSIGLYKTERQPRHRFSGLATAPGSIRRFCDGHHIQLIPSVLASSKIAIRAIRQIAFSGACRQPFGPRKVKGKPMISANVTRAAAVFSTIGLGVVFGFSPSAAQEADVAYVEAVSGRVVASVRGTPTLLDATDVIGDRTRLDVPANSELHVCHYRLRRILTMSGPARVTVSAGGITVESGKAAVVSQETCAAPQASNFQGGLVARGVSFKR